MARNLSARGKWKKVKIEPTMYLQQDLKDLICFEELTDYDISYGDAFKLEENNEEKADLSSKQLKKKKRKLESKQPEEDEIIDKEQVEESGQSVEEVMPAKKLKRTLHKSVEKQVNNEEDELNSETSTDNNCQQQQKKKKKKSKGKTDKKDDIKVQSPSVARDVENGCLVEDMSAWNGLSVPEPVLRCLAELGYAAPMPIQALALPPAINDRLDIVGAAETGSGKTLAFGIPLIHHIIMDKQKWEAKNASEELERDSSRAADDETEKMDFDNDPDEASDDDRDETEENLISPSSSSRPAGPLYALVVTPTRELAVQIRNHIEAITKYTTIKCCVVVGGMAIQKQTRLLRRCPEIVIGTPGRLWELIEQGNQHLAKVEDLRYLVIDEADRMVEKGHFQELTNILQLINGSGSDKNAKSSTQRRQTFVFSATLTFVPTKPQRLDFVKKRKKKGIHQITTKEKLDSMMCAIGVREKKVRVIDLTAKEGTAARVVETRLPCSVEEKDLYLYYIIRQYTGRTLVFANSKDCVRRLMSIFSLLHCSPLSLHADMQQRQRLKNLDRFKGNPKGLLIATDVAARGLDIPDVQHVIHYQVPRTTENYVHRSGRTARAMKEGLSVMFVAPDDLANYRKIIKMLNRNEELALFPIDSQCLSSVKPLVSLARRIDKEEHSVTKTACHNRWFIQAAKDLDIELDDDQLIDESENSQQTAAVKRKLQMLKRELDQMLTQPVVSRKFSAKYPTKSGQLVTPVNTAFSMQNTIQQVKDDQMRRKGRKAKKKTQSQSAVANS